MKTVLSRWFGVTRPNDPDWIAIPDLHQRIAGGEAVVIVDVRQPEEFTALPGHLPGARNIPLGAISEHAEALASLNEPIVLVCKTDRRSARAASELSVLGVRNVAVLRGGTDGWHEQGLPLE
jgi:rhodanese-related sulfurtransferase